MKTKIKLSIIMLVALLVPGIIVLGCNQKKPAEQAANAVIETETAEPSNQRFETALVQEPVNESGLTAAADESDFEFYIGDASGMVRITAYTGSDRDVIIPSLIQGTPVITIENEAFYDKGLTSVTIPNTVGSIGDNAFRNNQLTSVTLSRSTSIGDNAFDEDVQIIYRDGSPSANESDFTVEIMDVRGLGLELENGIKITAYTGSDRDVIIPSQIQGLTVTHIGEYAFFRKQITSVVIPNSVIAIGEDAFSQNQLTSVTIPDSVIAIGDTAFGSNQLTGVTIPNSVTSIGHGAFWGNQLTSVTIPDSVTELVVTFRLNQLTSVIIPNSVISIGAEAFMDNHLTSVTIPDSVTKIGYRAFFENHLTSVTIRNSVTEIGEEAFANNQLTSIYIPISVTKIGDQAFAGNPLAEIHGGDNGELEIGWNAFDNEYTEMLP